jgi:GxxExxY protein
MLKENEVATTIVDVAYHIHRQLGPGLLESVYHAIMKYELEKRGLRVLSKEHVPIIWEEVELPLAFEADLIVEDVVVELKLVEQEARVHKKQLLTYLRLTNCRLGLLINFGSEYISDGISRVVNGLPSLGLVTLTAKPWGSGNLRISREAAKRKNAKRESHPLRYSRGTETSRVRVTDQ